MPDDHDDIRTLLTEAASDVPPFPPFPERTVRRARRRAAATVGTGAVVVCLVAALIVGVVVDRPRSGEGPAHTTRTKSVSKLVVVDVATGAVRILEGAPDDAGSADVSPDGTKVAFTLTRGGTSQVYVIGVDGSALERATHDPLEAGQPAWSPDGSTLAYVGFGQGTSRSIIALDLASGHTTRLTHGPRDVSYPAWSSDGRRLLFMTDTTYQRKEGETADRYLSTSIIDVTTGAIERLVGYARSRSSAQFAAWSPVDDRIAFVASRAHFRQTRIVVLDTESGARTDLTDGGDFLSVWAPLWSPDGTMIAFTATGAGGDPTSYVVPADGSAPPRQVAEGLWVEDWLSNDQLITTGDPGEASS